MMMIMMMMMIMIMMMMMIMIMMMMMIMIMIMDHIYIYILKVHPHGIQKYATLLPFRGGATSGLHRTCLNKFIGVVPYYPGLVQTCSV